MPPEPGKNLPRSVEEWKAAAQPNGTIIVDIGASIHEQFRLNSGSEMDEEDFLHLKTVWPNADFDLIDKHHAHTQLRLGTWFAKAHRDLDNSPDFDRYLSAVERRDAPSPDIGMFWAAYEQQYQVVQLLHHESTTKRAYKMNEEHVNMSLVSFLQAVCACHPGLDISCNPARVHLTFDFRQVKEQKAANEINSSVLSLSCRTDGLIESSTTGRMQAILEAKARARAIHEPKVSWQETAEMVTAALSDRESLKHTRPGRVILFSQDGDEFYVSEATIKVGYVKHMKDERKAPIRESEFVKIHQCGPYWVQSRQDVQYFAKLVLAIALRESQEETASVSTHCLRSHDT
ncbi:uncharacterized protein N7515_007881 [Penicillium bovifimosum]|uniref:Uncharacterized protein n=1 Tax=Penicillium bovifimosum TaxID=126998 RepID=A0A9W9GLZ1_9EURO|nr:uncharacterized protein N7515_007881 [Penicillium bovifimosum]KAJ5124056.1 hypothetical protein N7515_007881 [Penicillium bovifimosum]